MAELLGLGDRAVSALARQDYGTAASSLVAGGPWDPSAEGARQVREVVSLFRTIVSIGDAVRVEHDSADDPRCMLTLRLTGGTATLASLIQETEQA